MYEYLLWNNCSNNCEFCWQKFKNDPNKMLDVKEQCHSIDLVIYHITRLPYCDILIVGGEIMEYTNYKVYEHMYKLFLLLHKRLKNCDIRYLYLNTNLLYTDLELCAAFLSMLNRDNLLHKLKFTTSYDIYGRFENEQKRKLFLKNLHTLTYSYKRLNIVVNTMLSKQYCESDFDLKAFCNKYRVQVNLIPYITLHENMRPTNEQIITKLQQAEEWFPGYIKQYINNFNLQQERFLYEYHKEKGYEYCSCDNAKCGHSENFKKILVDESCYVCQLKNWFQNHEGD